MDTGNVLLHDISEKENMWVETDSMLRQMFQLMRKNDKGVVVVLKERKPVGILTGRDVVRLLYAGADLDEKTERYSRNN